MDLNDRVITGVLDPCPEKLLLRAENLITLTPYTVRFLYFN